MLILLDSNEIFTSERMVYECVSSIEYSLLLIFISLKIIIYIGYFHVTITALSGKHHSLTLQTTADITA
jgi:Flp pilus assembly pilin Flp